MTDRIHEEIVAYLDGEMTGAARLAFETRIAGDPGLAQAADDHRDVLTQLHIAYPVPAEKRFDTAELEKLGLWDQGVVTQLAPKREARQRRRISVSLWCGAIAASLVGGLIIGRMDWWEQGLVVQQHGQLVATSRLDKALTEWADGVGSPIHIGLSFRSAKGVCRTFRIDGGYAGIGCRDGNGWTIPMLANPSSLVPASPDFRLAGSDFPASVMNEVDARIVGEPLTQREVEDLRRQAWRSQ